MAVRPFLYLGDTVCKCVFTSVQLKPKLHTTEIYKQFRKYGRFRSIGRSRGKAEELGPQFPRNYIEKGPVHFSKMLKPCVFTILFSGTTFIAATIWEYERVRQRTYGVINSFRYFGIRKTGWRHEMEKWWRSLTEGQRIFAPICFLNVLAFIAWRIPVFQKTMVQYFCAYPASRTMCWPMLLSSFSHYSILHLAANMYVLHSFSSFAVASLGREQFLALYLIGGVVSSFTSILYKTALGLHKPSLGASGAIMAILGFVCTQYPDIHMSIVFLPAYKFTADVAIKAVMGMDLLGCLLRCQYLDHAAHLGGVLFGIFWQKWGNDNLWKKREPILAFWHELRGPPKS